MDTHKTPEQFWKELEQQVARERFAHGESDCMHGLQPQRKDPKYLQGYAAQYAKEQQESQGGSN